MEKTHFNISMIPNPSHESWVQYAVNPNRKAIVFVHGFWGKPIATWSEFEKRLIARRECKARDIYYFGYDGKYASLESCAKYFYDFLVRLFRLNEADVELLNLPSNRDRKSKEYTDVLIVGHSMGCIVIRRTLMLAFKRNQSWTSRCRLMLYAPAHFGAEILALYAEATGVGTVLAKLLKAGQFIYPPLRDLEWDSDYLKFFKSGLAAEVSKPGRQMLAAVKVIHGGRDMVVKRKFDCLGNDPESDDILGATHSSVCKPCNNKLEPLELLVTVL
jgi:hypothetical protein